MVCGVDTYAEITGIRKSLVHGHWTVLEDDELEVSGVRRGVLGHLLAVPVQLRCKGAVYMVKARVIPDHMMPY